MLLYSKLSLIESPESSLKRARIQLRLSLLIDHHNYGFGAIVREKFEADTLNLKILKAKKVLKFEKNKCRKYDID